LPIQGLANTEKRAQPAQFADTTQILFLQGTCYNKICNAFFRRTLG